MRFSARRPVILVTGGLILLAGVAILGGLYAAAGASWQIRSEVEDLRERARDLDGLAREIVARGGVTPETRAAHAECQAGMRRSLNTLWRRDPHWLRIPAMNRGMNAVLAADRTRMGMLERAEFEAGLRFDRGTMDPALDDFRSQLSAAAREQDARGWALTRIAIAGTTLALLLVVLMGVLLVRSELRARSGRLATLERRRSEERFRTMADTAPAILWVAGPDMNATFLNRRWLEFTGHTIEQEMGGGWAASVHPEDIATLQETLVRSFERREPFQLESRFLRHDGEYRWLLNVGAPSHGDDGEFAGFVGSCIDLTDRRRAEAALRESETRYRQLFDRYPLPTYVFHLDTLRVLDVNEAAILHYGYAREEFLDLTLKDLRPAEDVPALVRALKHFSEGGTKGTWRHRKKDGTIFDVEVFAHRISLNGQIVGLSIAQDVSSRKQLEAEYRQAQRMEAVGRLAGGIAHDFNNMLTAVLGYSQMLLARHRDDPDVRGPVEEIEKAGRRAAELTRRLLVFSRKQILQPEIVSLNQVVSGMANMLRRLIGEDVELVTALAPSLDSVRVDPGQVEQVIMNLAVNARDAMPAGGRITIATANVELTSPAGIGDRLDPGRYVELSVTDTGCGMDDATQARIFEPFFTTKEIGKGTGLGLAAVYGIVRQSGGGILLRSAPDQGSTFRILFPRTGKRTQASPQSAESVASPDRMTGGSESILLVEDEHMVRALAHEVLLTLGYRVIEATNGAEALAIAEAYGDRIDLLVSDVVMPRMTGCELAAALAPRRPEMKLLYMSGYADRYVEGGLDPQGPVLQKPFTPWLLARKVREVLEAA